MNIVILYKLEKGKFLFIINVIFELEVDIYL